MSDLKSSLISCPLGYPALNALGRKKEKDLENSYNPVTNFEA